MIHSVEKIVSFISGIFTLEPGDVSLTGTPSGVGQVQSGDIMEAEVASVGRLKIFVQ
jgi:5-carboxymethyl-2-hydroxymuconate isomerase